MVFTLEEMTKDIDKVDFDDILSSWQWCLADMSGIVMITCVGDLFLQGKDGAIYWLQTDCGDLTKIAESLEEFNKFLDDEDKLDNWLLPSLVEKLIKANKILKGNEVYSYIKPPVIGGEYSVDNILPTEMNAHFFFSGQIFKQLKNVPDGSQVSIKLDKEFRHT
jgi:hypothetical protein